MIERARDSGLDNQDIAAALEGSIVFRPVTIGTDDHNRLIGMMMEDEITLTDLFNPSDETRRSR